MRPWNQLLAGLIFLVGASGLAVGETSPGTAAPDSVLEVTLEMTVKYSGLFSKRNTVIEYVPSNKAIIAVHEDGEEVPQEDYGKYRRLLWEALEVSEIPDLVPELDAFNRAFEGLDPVGDEMLEGLQTMMNRLEGLQSDFAQANLSLLRVHERAVKLGMAIEKVQEEVERSEPDLVGKEYELMMDRGWVYVNGDRMTKELSERCVEIFEEISGEKVNEHERSFRWDTDKFRREGR